VEGTEVGASLRKGDEGRGAAKVLALFRQAAQHGLGSLRFANLPQEGSGRLTADFLGVYQALPSPCRSTSIAISICEKEKNILENLHRCHSTQMLKVMAEDARASPSPSHTDLKA